MSAPERPRPCEAELLAISRYLEGDLTPRRAQALERHLETCRCCADLADSLRDTIERCRAAELRHVPADVRERARARVRALLAAPPASAPSRPTRSARPRRPS